MKVTQPPYPYVLTYVVYGDDEIYYEGVKVSILSFFSQVPKTERPLVVVLSQRPEFFADFPVITLTLSDEQKNTWATDGYWYRLKTLGLAYIVEYLKNEQLIDSNSKLLFFDTDTYFERNPMPLYQLISPTQVVMYKKESKISHRKKYRAYRFGTEKIAGATGLDGKTVEYEYGSYRLQKGANMWSSLIMGIMPDMLPQLHNAAALMYPMTRLTDARTVEQFCFAEVFKQRHTLIAGKAYVKHYSRNRQKDWVREQLPAFWLQHQLSDFETMVTDIQQIRFQRPRSIAAKQWLARVFGKNE